MYPNASGRFHFLLILLACAVVPILAISSCRSDPTRSSSTPARPNIATTARFVQSLRADTVRLEHATFAMGCFWHSEEIFLELRGVIDAVPGYCGGHTADPTYDEVSTGTTGYAESVDVAFDPSVISYSTLLRVFFQEHDPTTPDRQDPDEGPQYRSAIFYHDTAQEHEARDYIKELSSEHRYHSPIVTELARFRKFYPAEDYHLRFVRNHPDQPYVASVTMPEIEKFRRDFPELLKRRS